MQGLESSTDAATLESSGLSRRRVAFFLAVGLCLTLGLYAIVVNVLAYQGNVLSREVNALSSKANALVYETNTLTRAARVLADNSTEASLGAPAKPVVPNQTMTVRVAPSIQSVSPGDTFSVTVEIVDVLDLGAFEFRLNYTQSCIQPDGVELGDFLGSTGRTVFEVGPNLPAGGVEFGAFTIGTSAGPNGDGALAIITFRASSSPCQSVLQFQDVIVTDITGATITASTEDGQVTVEQVQPPQVASISPDWGHAGRTIEVVVRGQHFRQGASVQLNKAGSDPIQGTFASVQSTTTISCTLNLGRATPGLWDVVVTNPDSQNGSLPNGFVLWTYIYLPVVLKSP